ncbi:MAG: SulP family inorganic anion transporter [Dehalococcoidia bacterium]|nr:SulP family inorganic anion transporter [Dehalococcoidia bacterium]
MVTTSTIAGTRVPRTIRRRLQAEWFSNTRADVLSGLVVALALIPEAIAFSIIAGVDPKVGLYASFSIAVITAFAGGRPAMISAATAAMAVVLVSLVRDHGLQYLFATTILTGVIQLVGGFLRIGQLMRFVSRSVMTGFVNALAILIFLAQVPEMVDVPWATYPMIAAGLAIIFILPRFTRAIPSPLIAIVTLTAASLMFGMDVHTVGDMGELPSSLPVFLVPDVPLNLETLEIIFPYAFTLAIVGLLESLMTASVIDDLTHTSSDKNREARGQGIANIATGFLGGMAGCAMIGQSVINVTSGGRTRLSTLVAGTMLLFLIVVLGPWVARIPMPALVAVMIMVSVKTFSWASLGRLRTNPRTSSTVMVATVVVVVATHNLALGVLAGVLLSGVFFAWKVARLLHVEGHDSEDGSERRYEVSGQVFFASADHFRSAFDLTRVPSVVTIDATRAHLWDVSSVAALDAVVLDYRRLGAEVNVIGMNEATAALVGAHAVHDKATATLPTAH